MVRLALSRERVIYKGETLELPLPDGPGKALKLTIGPKQERIPLYLAAIGPNNTRLAGEIADGWLPTFFSPEHVGLFRAFAREGAARAGRCSMASRSHLRSASTSTRTWERTGLHEAGACSVYRRDGLAREELLQHAGASIRV